MPDQEIQVLSAFGSGKFVTPRNISVYLPPDYHAHTGQRFPVLYLQDGQNLFHAERSFAGIAWRVDETARDLIPHVTQLDWSASAPARPTARSAKKRCANWQLKYHTSVFSRRSDAHCKRGRLRSSHFSLYCVTSDKNLFLCLLCFSAAIIHFKKKN